MVTIAQALHWLDRDKFFAECKRVLKNKGCLAVYGYGNVRVVNEQCNALVSNFYRNSLKGCWHEARYHIDNEYRSIHPPFSNTHRVDMTMPYKTSHRVSINMVRLSKILRRSPGEHTAERSECCDKGNP